MRIMKLTSFGFVELAETFLKDALSSPPLGGGKWEFQRAVNFNERAGSLQILLANSIGATKTKVSIHARQTGTEKDYSIQGWTEIPDEEKRTIFVLKESNPVRVEEEVFEIVDRLLAAIPERDQSVTFERPAPPPKSTFEPLIPEIQSAPAEPEPAPVAEVSSESFDSTQAFVDSLLSPDSFDKIQAEDAPASEPAEEPVAEEATAPEEEAPADATQKAKAAKPAKAKKPAK